MVISRKGKMVKWDKTQNTLKNAHDIKDVYDILEQFHLTNEENCTIAQQWQRGQHILAVHGVEI